MDDEKPNQATLRDVALAAGVDVSTVSRVLQNKTSARVREETRLRIHEAAERLSYRANPLARALKTARSHTLLMVVPQLENPVFTSAIVGAQAEAEACGYTLLIAYTRQGAAENALESVSRSSLIEGVVIASFDNDDRLRQTIDAIHHPCVVMNRILADHAACVALDTRSASALGVTHLLELGHRRIGHLAGRLGRFNGDARYAGWRDALQQAGLEAEAQLVVEVGYETQGVPAAVETLLRRGVTAIHAATLLTGASTVSYLHSIDVAVPADISVVTMHEDMLARVVHPQITTVSLPTEMMGRRAVRMLLQMLNPDKQDVATGGSVLLAPNQLIVRGTSAPPRAQL